MKNLLVKIGKQSKKAFLSQIHSDKKNRVLKDYCSLIQKNKKIIIKENQKDIRNAHKKKLKNNLIERLVLSEKKISNIIDSIKKIIKLKDPTNLILENSFPISNLCVDKNKPICVYNYYNIDPTWRQEISANRVLLIEPSIFNKYPISNKNMSFFLKLAENIENIKIYVGEFSDLLKFNCTIYFKEHPLNNYTGTEDQRDTISINKEYQSSFFKFWKKNKNEIAF